MEEYNKNLEIKTVLQNIKDLVMEYKENNLAYQEVLNLLQQHKDFVKKYDSFKNKKRKHYRDLIITVILLIVLISAISYMILPFLGILPIVIMTIITMITALPHISLMENEYSKLDIENEFYNNKTAYQKSLEMIKMYEKVVKPRLLTINKEILNTIKSELTEYLPLLCSDNSRESELVKSFVNNDDINNLVSYYNQEDNSINSYQKKLV